MFYLKGVVPPEVKTTDIYIGVIPFVAIQVIIVAAVFAFEGAGSLAARADVRWLTRTSGRDRPAT